MDSGVRHTTTSDGVSIAYNMRGSGPPLVFPPPALPFSHIEREQQIPGWRHFHDHLCDAFTVVRYDNRGAGMSEREVDDLSIEANLADLQAVIDDAGIDRFALMGFYYTGPITIAYAAAHPERVERLLLWCSFPSAVRYQKANPLNEALNSMMSADWGLFTETLSHSVFGWTEGEEAHQFALYMQDAITPEVAKRCWEVHSLFDVTDTLPRVQAPTLVMHRRQFPLVELAAARELASGIPNARLVLLDGASLSPYVGDMDAVLKAIDEFTGGEGRMTQETHARAAAAGGFRTIMFTDMVESTANTQRMGDAEAQQVVRLHNDIVRSALHSNGGEEVKHTGDGIMASFTSATLAIECAMEVQRRIAFHVITSHSPLRVRIGINAGEPLIEGGDLFGTAVQLASRVCTRAEAGQVLVTDVVRQLVAGKGFLFADGGEQEMRGFEDPVRVFEVRWREGDG